MLTITRSLTLAVVTVWASLLHAQSPSTQLLSSARSDVGLVVATNCSDGGDRSGTAFVWPQADQVVTARHVVAGCDRIMIQFRDHGSFNAVPLREIRSQDLIALQLDKSVGASVLSVTDHAPPVHSQVAAVGFALGAPTADDKLLRVTTANDPPPARLKEMLPDAERRLIQQNGPWDLETAILRLDGNLTHGHSGAPVFDHEGRVVAVGAGGLQSGASGIVWAVRAEYLLNAANWTSIQSGQRVTPESALAFSVQPPQARLEQVDCGGFTLSRSRTSSFQEIAAVVDDPDGLYMVQSAVGFNLPINFDALQFDIWEDLGTGAVIPLPQGKRPRQEPGGCTATVGNGVDIWIRAFDGSDRPGDMSRINAFSIQFENDIEYWLGQLFPDPQFTYSYPLTRPDGFMANRKGAAGPQIAVDMMRMYQNYGFVTHVGRNGYYLGVAALRQQSIVDFGLINECQIYGGTDVCAQAFAPMQDWAAAALSVHMSTMPPI